MTTNALDARNTPARGPISTSGGAVKPTAKPARTPADTLASLEGPTPVPQTEIAADQLASDIVDAGSDLPDHIIVQKAVENAEKEHAALVAEAEKAAARVAQAKKAAEVRWNKEFNWDAAPMEEALLHLAELRAAAQTGGIILERRISSTKVTTANCAGCGKLIEVASAKGNRTRNNPETGLPEIGFACSAACFMAMGRDFTQLRAEKEPRR